MPGRPKIALYHYTAEGKRLGEFECIADVRRKYYGERKGKLPIEFNEYDLHTLPDNTIVSTKKVGREYIKKAIKFANCPYCSTNKKRYQRPVYVYNLKGELIAKYKNQYIAYLMSGVKQQLIYDRLRKGSIHFKKTSNNNLIFTYEKKVKSKNSEEKSPVNKVPLRDAENGGIYIQHPGIVLGI